MKSTVSNNFPTKVKPYPKLMTATSGNGTIVLSDRPGQGVCIFTTETRNRVGEYITDWLWEKHWRDFNGSVCLEND